MKQWQAARTTRKRPVSIKRAYPGQPALNALFRGEFMKKRVLGNASKLPAICLLSMLAFFYAAADRAWAEEGQPVVSPDGFCLKSTEGEYVSLKDFRDKKVVHLVFWATWCPHCLIEMTKIRDLHKSMDSARYELLAIDVGVNDTLARIKKIQCQYQIPGQILIDGSGEVTRKYGIIGVPYHIIIGKDGSILDRFNELPADYLNYFKKFLPPEN
jgi:peroxiredoxin